MPPASAARSFNTPATDDPHGPRAAPLSEQMRPEPRFRVVTRKPLVRHIRRVANDSLQRNLIAAAFPVLCLLVYVMFWTLAMRGGYYRDQLREQIRNIRIERAELEAEKLRLQSPQAVLDRAAKELGMVPAEQREFARLETGAHGQ